MKPARGIVINIYSKEMKRILIIDLDTERQETVKISVGEESDKGTVVHDMACLCEGLCTLIHAADQIGVKDSAASLRDCINHLEQGFVDASYKASSVYKPILAEFTTKEGFVFNVSKGKRPLKLDGEKYGPVENFIPVEMHMLENGAKDNRESLIFISHSPSLPFMAIGQLSLKMWREGLEKIGYTIQKVITPPEKSN